METNLGSQDSFKLSSVMVEEEEIYSAFEQITE
jgi:hypothetical protein